MKEITQNRKSWQSDLDSWPNSRNCYSGWQVNDDLDRMHNERLTRLLTPSTHDERDMAREEWLGALSVQMRFATDCARSGLQV